jgi:hypothetical protein
MTRRKLPQCSRFGCYESPYAGNLCKEHYEEDLAKRRLREEALDLLHRFKVDGTALTKPEIREEYSRLERWWDRACRAVNFNRVDAVLQDEAEYAVEWCIAIATSLVEEERLFRQGISHDPMQKVYRDDVWARFSNLEAGLMSNGVARRV